MFIRIALVKPRLTALLTTRRIFQRQIAVKNLSHFTYNNLYCCIVSFSISYCY